MQSSVPSLAGALLNNKGKLLFTFCLGIALTMAYFALATRYYSSDAKLFVKLGRQTVTLDPTANTGQSISVRETQNQEVFSVEELISSRRVAEKIVDHFGPAVIREERFESEDEEEGGFSLNLSERLSVLDDVNLNPLRVYSERDKAVKTFSKSLGVLAGKKTNILSMSYKSKSPEFSYEVLKQLIRVVLEEHLHMHRIQGSQEFFVEQTNLLRDNLNKLEEELKELKTDTGLASIETQRAIHLTMLGALRERLIEAEAGSDALSSELDARRDKIKNMPRMIVLQQTTDQPQTVGQAMREKLYDLEVQEQQLASKFTDTHPKLVQVRKQIVEARSIADGVDNRPAVTTGINTTYQAVENIILEREAAFVAQAAKIKAIKQDIEEAEAKLVSINQSEIDIKRLEREIDLVYKNYRTYSENLEQARIDNEIEAKKISSLNVMQEPTFVETPVSPKPLITLVLGTILSAILGMAVAIRSEMKKLKAITGQRKVEPSSNGVSADYVINTDDEPVLDKKDMPTAWHGKVKARRVSAAPTTPR